MEKLIRATTAIETAKKQVADQMAHNTDAGFDEFLLGFLKLFTKVIHDTPAVEDEGTVRCPKCNMTYSDKYLSDDSCCYQCGSKLNTDGHVSKK